MQNKDVTLRGTLWKLEDVNELERELIKNIEKLDGEESSSSRLQISSPTSLV